MNSKVRKNIADSSLPYLMWTHFVDFPSCVMSRGLCDACPILHKLIESQEGVAELVLEKTGPRERLYVAKINGLLQRGRRLQARSPKS